MCYKTLFEQIKTVCASNSLKPHTLVLARIISLSSEKAVFLLQCPVCATMADFKALFNSCKFCQPHRMNDEIMLSIADSIESSFAV